MKCKYYVVLDVLQYFLLCWIIMICCQICCLPKVAFRSCFLPSFVETPKSSSKSFICWMLRGPCCDRSTQQYRTVRSICTRWSRMYVCQCSENEITRKLARRLYRIVSVLCVGWSLNCLNPPAANRSYRFRKEASVFERMGPARRDKSRRIVVLMHVLAHTSTGRCSSISERCSTFSGG